MLPLQDMLALLDEAGIEAVRAKSVGLTAYAIGLADELLALLGVEVASPRDPDRRGGHVTLRHPRMREVTAALWQRDVIPDYRDPTACGSGCRRCRRRTPRSSAAWKRFATCSPGCQPERHALPAPLASRRHRSA